ncbi:MAG: SDR family oxidoreductase [Pseudolabrys sp.]|nr:SDR family oxidoreductase [Pseudolabrys sp.]
MSGRLAGKTAIVTGGGGGIGSAVGALFCAEGASVVLADHDDKAVTAAVAAIKAATPSARVTAVVTDVASDASAAKLVAAAVGEFGGLDVLVNNAAVRSYEPLADASAESWNRVLSVNLLSYAFMIKAALPQLRSSGRGSIVNVSSTYALSGRAGMGQYDATKAAIISLTRTCAFEEAEHGVRVNAVCPGYTLTPFHVARAEASGGSREALENEHLPHCLMKRWARAEEAAYPILWLASDEASYMTASTVAVDGGRPVG